MDGKFQVTHELFCSLPAVDGRGDAFNYDGELREVPLTQEERDLYIKGLYRNTLDCLRYGMLLPATENHDDPDPELKGALVGIKLTRKQVPQPHYVITGDIVMGAELYRKYRGGLLPGMSVDIYPYGDLAGYGGGKISDYIGAVTFSGSKPVAMPWLRETDATEVAPVLTFQIMPKPRTFAAIGQPTEDAVDEAKLKEMIAATVMEIVPPMVAEILKQAAAGGEVAEEVVAPEADPAAEKKVAELEAEIEETKAEMGGMAFAAMGLPAELKPKFMASVKKNGLAFTRELFAAFPVQSAKVGAITQPGTAQAEPETDEQLVARYAGLGIKDAEARKIIEFNRKKVGAAR